ncbi:kelch-like protein 10 isoform X1 [Paramormyrops kingsleyae]|uniref:kelch-like protein 10 isoform X1 n=1 Tax=Paramormyrops kingsleyae TaxID=1676925 RepID=UPI003B96F42B
MMAYDMEREMMSLAFPVFNKLRLAGQMCDVVLVANNVKFEAHRIILCGCSSYFQALFNSSWNVLGKREYKFPGVSPDTLRQIIEYAYTYSVLVTADNVESLLAAADQLNILGIVQRCSGFLHDQLCTENCIGLLKIADVYCLRELHKSAFNLILRNFKEVAITSEEFPDLTLHELSEIIEKDELNVREEGVVFEAILRWIMHEPANRKAHISVLLPKVRMARMDPEFFMRTIKKNHFVKANVACRPIIEDVLKTMYDLDDGPACSDFANPLIRPRLPSEMLLAVGGWSRHRLNRINAYDTRADRWVDVTQEDDKPNSCHGTVYVNGYVYCIGGYDGTHTVNTVHRFNTITRAWQQVAPMHSCRCYPSVTVVDGHIYAMGGRDDFMRLNSAERYDPATNEWTLIRPMQERRNCAGATTLNGKIYVCGGFTGAEPVSAVECYDPLTGEWTTIAPMSSPRYGHGVVAYKGRIYAVGGTDGSQYLRSVEAYDPTTNSWHTVAPMSTIRSYFGIAVVDDQLFVLGGYDGLGVNKKVECYDAETGSWYHAQDMIAANDTFSCCVVPALPRIVQYASPR